MSSAFVKSCVRLWRRAPRADAAASPSAIDPAAAQPRGTAGREQGWPAGSSLQHRGWHCRVISAGRAGMVLFLSSQGTVPGLGLLPLLLLGREIPVLAGCRACGCAWKAVPGRRESSVQAGQHGDVISAL